LSESRRRSADTASDLRASLRPELADRVGQPVEHELAAGVGVHVQVVAVGLERQQPATPFLADAIHERRRAGLGHHGSRGHRPGGRCCRARRLRRWQVFGPRARRAIAEARHLQHAEEQQVQADPHQRVARQALQQFAESTDRVLGQPRQQGRAQQRAPRRERRIDQQEPAGQLAREQRQPERRAQPSQQRRKRAGRQRQQAGRQQRHADPVGERDFAGPVGRAPDAQPAEQEAEQHGHAKVEPELQPPQPPEAGRGRDRTRGRAEVRGTAHLQVRGHAFRAS